ncbi:uncharacterized protein LOC143449128 [Clavelina lepadiformis]|uniref:uncharacterized protein LOC143449128 n=1 Tax=Clavelina lepadiformis TaxID=159417 RepID=UPI00404216A8
MRKLLFHRGLDDQFGTYVTDYITGSMFLIYGACLAILAVKIRRAMKPHKSSWARSSRESSRSDILLMGKTQKCNRSSRKKESYEVSNSLASLKSDYFTMEVENSPPLSFHEEFFLPKNLAQHTFLFNVTTTSLFVACGLMNVLGGLAHQYVQSEHDVFDDRILTTFTTKTSEIKIAVEKDIGTRNHLLPWYVLWETANIFGGLVAASFVFLIPCSLSVDAKSRTYCSSWSRKSFISENFWLEKRDGFQKFAFFTNICHFSFVVKRGLQVFAFAIAVLSLLHHSWNIYVFISAFQNDNALLAHLPKAEGSANWSLEDAKEVAEDWKPINLGSLWSTGATTYFLALSVFFYACFSSYKMVSYLKFSSKTSHDKRPDLVQCNLDAKKDTSSTESFLDNSFAESYITSFEHFGHSSVVTVNKPSHKYISKRISRQFVMKTASLIRCFASWIILFSGVIHFSFGNRCGFDDAFETHGCPFPNTFNHNSLYHVILAVGMTFLFFGELLVAYYKCSRLSKI